MFWFRLKSNVEVVEKFEFLFQPGFREAQDVNVMMIKHASYFFLSIFAFG
jgi:hypothetical protein